MDGVFNWVESMTPDENTWLTDTPELDGSLLDEADSYFVEDFTIGGNHMPAQPQQFPDQKSQEAKRPDLHTQNNLYQQRVQQTSPSVSSPYPFSTPSTPVYHTSPASSSLSTQPTSSEAVLRPPPVKEEAHTLLLQIKQSVEKQAELLAFMDTYQRQFLASPTTESFNQLVGKQLELKQNLTTEAQLISQLRLQELLTLPSLVLLYKLMDTISVQTQQLQLYQAEMMASLEQKPNPCVAVLVLESQPQPTIYKEKSTARVEDEQGFKLRLLKCSSVNITAGKIQVSSVFKSTQVKSENPLEPSSIQLDPTFHVTYKVPKFLVGSRMQPAVLKFDMNITWGSGLRAAVSVCSRPYIIVTHESQFEESMKNLFIHEVFRDRTQIPWKLFANEISLFFIKATRQNLSKISQVRGLSPSDLYFIQTRKFCCQEDGHVTLQQFEAFWTEWFGRVLRELRFKRRLMLMWEFGLICGFIDKDSLKLCMQGKESGHVMLRFSESQPGAIAATAWVGQKLWNGLIKSNDTKTKSHAEFIRDKPEITHVLQFMNEYTTNGGFRSVPVLRSIPKATALYEFCSVKEEEEEEGNAGYDNWDSTPDITSGSMYPFNVYNSNFSMFPNNTNPNTVPLNPNIYSIPPSPAGGFQQGNMQQQFDLNSFNLSNNYSSFLK